MSLVNKVLTKLRFSKTWLSKENFPTYEMREDQVRADMQYLHDETQTAFNNLVDDLESLSAENIPFTSSTAVPASDVQSAIVNVQQQVAEASAATIPNGSITDEKFAPGALANKADLVDGIVKADQMRLRVKRINENTHTLDASDIGCLLRFVGSATEYRVVIPTVTSDIPVGSVFKIVHLVFDIVIDNDGGLGVSLFSGNVIYSNPAFRGSENIITLIKLGDDAWLLDVTEAHS